MSGVKTKRPRRQGSSDTAPVKTKEAIVRTEAAATAPSQSSLGDSCSSALLVAGTYHSVVAGLVLKKEKFYVKFSTKRHVGCVNQVAATDRYIATSGVDERVFIFTNKADQNVTPAMRERLRRSGEPMAVRLADLGSVTPPAEVMCLRFTEHSQHLLCGLADGQLLVYKSRDWTVATHLSVHERGLVNFDIHPHSGGTLVVSIGADRVVAVLDLSKGRLMTKWKYQSCIDPDTAVGQPPLKKRKMQRSGAIEEEDMSDADGAMASNTNPLARLQQREEPVAVQFSPSGDHFVVLSHYSFVVYRTGTMQSVAAYRQPSPQPESEMHSIAFIDDATIVVGNEAGRLLLCMLGVCASLEVRPMSVEYSEALLAEVEALPEAPSPALREQEARRKNPLRHTARVKAITRLGATLFSIDSNGVLIGWTMRRSNQGSAAATTLRYVASANCQGRVTSMSALTL